VVSWLALVIRVVCGRATAGARLPLCYRALLNDSSRRRMSAARSSGPSWMPAPAPPERCWTARSSRIRGEVRDRERLEHERVLRFVTCAARSASRTASSGACTSCRPRWPGSRLDQRAPPAGRRSAGGRGDSARLLRPSESAAPAAGASGPGDPRLSRASHSRRFNRSASVYDAIASSNFP